MVYIIEPILQNFSLNSFEKFTFDNAPIRKRGTQKKKNFTIQFFLVQWRQTQFAVRVIDNDIALLVTSNMEIYDSVTSERLVLSPSFLGNLPEKLGQ